ncbi:MaoC family dehydratase [Frondihabitans sp. PhB161]|uniref:MaoC family dehydratase n=1 Tax=Frondihabitans sp. PhB161 TaxID=2485193 RepID=UPI000F4DD872|nr:MaoC family dehydratase [Frondihabitans sp. PhB161]RPE74876.1 acyl dehydratase [Frondihabitans sp. PhB153]RPF04120.1 acyl dehydratase [Frondihabitans sp. PhB161]
MPAVFASPADLVGAEGRILGPSSWVTIDQGRIQAFADATGDQQWIHTDPARAADGPFGATIAHGFLTLSLTAAFAEELLRVDGTAQVINYGADKLRFLQPVLVGSRVRAVGEITSAASGASGVRLGYRLTVEIEGVERPALVVDTVTLFVPESV